ncbi:MAG: sigma factor-like helix-turn-helix DNA-binding protein [Planctomycetota bacterium]|jgi:hypothetical protein|nr:sigma factor-like helix-turn-helix DNA-binding protein [Planctomycetota bacterium]
MKAKLSDDSTYPSFGDCVAWAQANLGPATVRAMEDTDPVGIMGGNSLVKVNDVVLCFAWNQSRNSAAIRNEFIEYFFNKDLFKGMVTGKEGPKKIEETVDIEDSIYASMMEAGQSSDFQGERAFIRMLRQRAMRKINKLVAVALRGPWVIEEFSGRSQEPEGMATLMHALNRLPIEEQELLEWFYDKKRPVAWIASKLGLSEAAVRKRLERLRRRLREDLGD